MTNLQPRARITRYVAIACVAIIPLFLWWNGSNEDGLRLATRFTARIGFLFFAAAFFATSLSRAIENSVTAWMVRHRRQLGLSFACIHSAHLLFIGLLSGIGAPLGVAPFSIGWVALVMAALMTATSNDASQKRLGRSWRRLHALGGLLIAYVFALSLMPSARESVIALIELSILGVGMGLRAWRWSIDRRLVDCGMEVSRSCD